MRPAIQLCAGLCMRSPEDLLTTKQLASEYGLSHRSLERWRVEGSGPLYLQFQANGPVRYRRGDSEDWLNTKRRLSPGAPAPATTLMVAQSVDEAP